MMEMTVNKYVSKEIVQRVLQQQGRKRKHTCILGGKTSTVSYSDERQTAATMTRYKSHAKERPRNKRPARRNRTRELRRRRMVY